VVKAEGGGMSAKRWQQVVLVLNWGIAFLLLVSGWPMPSVNAEDELFTLWIRLRDPGGTGVEDEVVTLERLPAEEPVTPDCTTDRNGECAWLVEPGLYQVRFDRPLDELSALAVAEGGLSGFGLTVGSRPITYHFVFHSDGFVYFDTRPDAARPSPLIPSLADLDGGKQPIATPSMDAQRSEPAELGPPPGTPSAAAAIQLTGPATPTLPGRILYFIGFGLVMGIGLHLWSRARQTKSNRKPRHNREDSDA
jgi:hypothetical protein